MIHARRSPSGAHRWRMCPASAAVAEAYPEESNEHSDEGTAAHTLAAWCLDSGNDATAYEGRLIKVENRGGGEARTFEVDASMIHYVQQYLDRCRAWLDFAGASLFAEQSLSIEHITAEAGAKGTSDCVIILPGANVGAFDLVIRDLKYGRGVRVEAHENDQLTMYASAALEHFGLAYDFPDEAQVHMEIDQPRLGHTPRSTITVAQLRARVEEIRRDAAVAAATPADGKRVAGDWCRFCPARADCATLAAHVKSKLPADLSAKPDHTALAQHLRDWPAIKAWGDSLEALANSAIQRGETVPGWKLVTGQQGDRAWADPVLAVGYATDHGVQATALYTEPKLKSPAQIEKLLPKEARKGIAQLVMRAPGKPTLAPESDSRPSVLSDRRAGFDNLDAAGAGSIL